MKAAILSVCFCFATAWERNNIPIGFPSKILYVDPVIDELPVDFNVGITNGHEAIPHSIPYQAYLFFRSDGMGAWTCGGSLISPRHVLTAGHCLDGAVGGTAFLGIHNREQMEDTRESANMDKLILHEKFSNIDYSNDIGIIELDISVEFNEFISPVALPSKNDHSDYEGENARVSGWGRVSGDGNPSNVLLEVNSTVISNAECKKVYDIIIDSQICTSGLEGEGTCNGDSGGPLIAGDVQIGIVSYGAKGCPVGYPSAYTRVTSYLDWLQEKTGLQF